MELLIFSLIAFTTGVAYTWIRWGVQRSISNTFYSHENKALWYLWNVLYGLPILIAFPHFLTFLGASGIALVGVEPDFRGSKMQNHVHVLGAYLAILSGFTYLAWHGVWLPVIAMVIFTIAARIVKLNNLTTWVEVAAYYLIVIGLML